MVTILLSYLDVTLAAVAFIVYFILWKLKARELRRQAGVEANVLHRPGRPIQTYFGALERIMTVSIVLIVIAHFILPRDFALTRRLFGDNAYLAEAIGFIVCLTGLALCRLAQAALGRSWRVGIDEDAKPGMITTGLFRRIRNPTYAGLFLLCVGVFVVLPTVLISGWILVFFIMMEFQVRCEEEYLEKQYGEAYVEYKRKTKRYIPFLY